MVEGYRIRLRDMLDNLVYYRPDLAPVRLDDEVGYLPIQRVTLFEQLFENLPAVTGLEQRPFPAFRCSRELLVHGCIQVDNEPAAAEE